MGRDLGRYKSFGISVTETTPIRVRIAPSPTGSLHIGTARTALFNFLFARKNSGVFVLRIEDTDRERSTQAFEQNIIAGLDWLGITCDEGPETGGDFGPYRQSERADLYDQAVTSLLERRNAYYCFCTPEELEAGRRQAQSENRPYLYPGTCRHLSPDEIAQNRKEGKPSVVRFQIPRNVTIGFVDLIKGPIQFDSSNLGDFVIQKADGSPLYSLANVVDDARMRISHVLRGEDLLSSTPNQLLLYQALGHRVPEFGHLPLLLNPDRTKLSKRKGATSVTEFSEEGYLPEALVNFIAFLGWSPGTEEEFFSLAELEKIFSLDRVQKAGAVFDERRLRYMNAHYLKQFTPEELLARTEKWLSETGQEKLLSSWEAKQEVLLRAVPVATERAETLADLIEPLSLFTSEPQRYSAEELASASPQFGQLQPAERAELFEQALTALVDQPFELEPLQQWIDDFLRRNELPKPALLAPMRIALTGRRQSPGAAEMLYVFGKEESLRRLRDAAKLLQT